MNNKYEKQLEELVEQWPLDHANIRCELCRKSTEWECGRCSVPVCQDTSCIVSHIESYHPILMPDWMPEEENQ